MVTDQWTKDPFGAEIDENGNIFGRGTQDMKCVGIMALEALRRMKKPLKRTVHISFVPDEEVKFIDWLFNYIGYLFFKDWLCIRNEMVC